MTDSLFFQHTSYRRDSYRVPRVVTLSRNKGSVRAVVEPDDATEKENREAIFAMWGETNAD